MVFSSGKIGRVGSSDAIKNCMLPLQFKHVHNIPVQMQRPEQLQPKVKGSFLPTPRRTVNNLFQRLHVTCHVPEDDLNSIYTRKFGNTLTYLQFKLHVIYST